MLSKKKRHSITLLEIMIVIFLIGLIGGVLSYNLKGTLERGKKFRTEEGIRRLKEILDMEIERGTATVNQLTIQNAKEARDRITRCVTNSGFIASNDIDKFLMDGWKEYYSYTRDEKTGELVIHSERLEAYQRTHPES